VAVVPDIQNITARGFVQSTSSVSCDGDRIRMTTLVALRS